MSIGVSEASLSDIAAVTNRNDGYGNGDGMWGNGAWQLLPLCKVTYIEKSRY